MYDAFNSSEGKISFCLSLLKILSTKEKIFYYKNVRAFKSRQNDVATDTFIAQLQQCQFVTSLVYLYLLPLVNSLLFWFPVL